MNWMDNNHCWLYIWLGNTSRIMLGGRDAHTWPSLQNEHDIWEKTLWLTRRLWDLANNGHLYYHFLLWLTFSFSRFLKLYVLIYNNFIGYLHINNHFLLSTHIWKIIWNDWRKRIYKRCVHRISNKQWTSINNKLICYYRMLRLLWWQNRVFVL